MLCAPSLRSGFGLCLFVSGSERSAVVWTHVKLLHKLNMDSQAPDTMMKHYLGPVSQNPTQPTGLFDVDKISVVFAASIENS